jgi:hypothetical protein
MFPLKERERYGKKGRANMGELLISYYKHTAVSNAGGKSMAPSPRASEISTSVERAAMKAIQIEAFGNPAEVVKAVDISDVGAPAAGEVVIALEASPINQYDLLMITGGYGYRPGCRPLWARRSRPRCRGGRLPAR